MLKINKSLKDKRTRLKKLLRSKPFKEIIEDDLIASEFRSLPELKIAFYLEESGVDWYYNCPISGYGVTYYLDFYMPILDLVIEYDGKQHFEGTNHYMGDISEIRLRDKFKNKFIEENKLKLKRITYKEKITKELIYSKLMEE